jgi:membrane protein insertase Oxa1/YidC/SpoIIIJ
MFKIKKIENFKFLWRNLTNMKFFENSQPICVNHFDSNSNARFSYSHSKKFYNGLFQRPTNSLIPHLQILGIIETLKYFKFGFDLSWTASIIITSSLIRLIQIPTYWLVKDIKLEKILPKRIVNFTHRWSHKLIYNDLYIDFKRHKIDQVDQERMLKYYNPNIILSYIPQVMLLMNNFRALNSLSKGASDSTFLNDTFLNLNLATHDSLYILPVLIFINNYFFIKVTDHPWLINWSRTGKMKIIYLSLFMSLFSVFWPKCYCISWLSYSITHIIIKLIANYLNKRNKLRSSYKYYLQTEHKKKLIDFYNKN